MGGEQGFILFLETLRSRILPGRFQPSIQFVTIDVEMLSLFYNRNKMCIRDRDKEIPKNVHRPALDAVFANGNISNYDAYIERLKEGYGLQLSLIHIC